MAHQQHDQQHRGIDRDAQHEAIADVVPRVAVHGVGGEDGGEPLVQQVDRRAQDDQRDQCGQERPGLEVADQDAVDAADDGAGRQRRQDHRPHRQVPHIQEI